MHECFLPSFIEWLFSLNHNESEYDECQTGKDIQIFSSA